MKNNELLSPVQWCNTNSWLSYKSIKSPEINIQYTNRTIFLPTIPTRWKSGEKDGSARIRIMVHYKMWRITCTHTHTHWQRKAKVHLSRYFVCMMPCIPTILGFDFDLACKCICACAWSEWASSCFTTAFTINSLLYVKLLPDIAARPIRFCC